MRQARRSVAAGVLRAGLVGALAAGLVAGLTAGLVACQRFIPPLDLKAPELSVSQVRLDGLERGQARIGLTLDAYNPNAVELPLSEVQFEMRLFGQVIGRGWVDTPQILLPAQASQPLPLTLSIQSAELARALRRGLGKRLIGEAPEAPDWELQGSLRWGQNPLTLPWRKSGRLGESLP